MGSFGLGLDIYVVVLLAAALLNSKTCGGGVYEDALSRDNCGRLKGLLAVMVMFHHLAQRTDGGEIFHSFHHMGHLCVAAFLFLSGYGLMRQYMGRQDYLHGYLTKRLSAVCIPYLGCILLYWITSPAWRGAIYTPVEVLVSLVNGRPVAANSWYVIACIWLYLLFYVAGRLMKRRYWGIVGLSAAFCVAWIVACQALGYGIYWYMSNFGFVLGMIWALKEERWTPALKKWYWLALPAVTAAFLPTFWLTYHSDHMLSFGIVSSSLFVALVLLLLSKVKMQSAFMAWLGTISFEVYMIHGLFIALFRGTTLYVENEVLWVGLVLVCSVAAAVVLHKVFGALIRAFVKACAPKRTRESVR